MRGDPHYIGPLNGGLNTRDTILSIPVNQAYDSLNMIGDIDGTVRKRDPHIDLQSTFAGAGANDLSFLFYAVSSQTMLTSAGTKMYAVTKAGAVVTDITGANVLSSGAPYWCVEAPTSGGQGPVYILPADTVTTPKYSDGSATLADWTASSGTLDKGEFMLYFKNRVVMAGLLVGTNGAGLKSSAVGDPRNWDTTVSGASAAWLTNIDPFDGERIYGIGVVGNYLIVFKRTKCYVVYDMDTGANRPLSTAIGCTSRKSIITTPHGLMFLGNDAHVYVTDGTKIEKLSDVVGEPEAGTDSFSVSPLLTYFGGSDIQTDDGTQSVWPCAAYADDRYYLSCVGTVGGGTTWCYSFTTNSWWPMKTSVTNGREFTQIVSDRQRGNQEQIYGVVRHSAGKVPRLWKLFVKDQGASTYADPTANYVATYITPPLAPQNSGNKTISNPFLRRRYHAIRLWAQGVVDVQYVLDDLENAGSSIYTTLIAITTGQLNTMFDEYTGYSLGVGNTIRIKFTKTGPSSFIIRPFMLYTQPRTD
jgi:hypothetical protein